MPNLKTPAVHLFATFDRDLLRALQHAYYCSSTSLVPDEVFDKMEAEYIQKGGRPLPVGSDKAENYPGSVRALSLYLQMSSYESQQKSKLL